MIQLICRSNNSTDYQKETQTKTFASLFNNKKNKNKIFFIMNLKSHKRCKSKDKYPSLSFSFKKLVALT